MKRFVNGGLRLIKCSSNDILMNYYDREFDSSELITAIVNCDGFKKLHRKVFNEDINFELNSEPVFSIGTETLKVELFEAIRFGGAYSHITSDKDGSKYQIVEKFIKDFQPKPFTKNVYFKVFDPWSEWFSCVAWDYIYMILNKESTEIGIVCITDTD